MISNYNQTQTESSKNGEVIVRPSDSKTTNAVRVNQKNLFKRAKSDIEETNYLYLKDLNTNISKAPSFLRIYFENSTAVVKFG